MLLSMCEIITNNYNTCLKNIKALFPAVTFATSRSHDPSMVPTLKYGLGHKPFKKLESFYSPHLGTYNTITVIFFPMVFTYPHLHNKTIQAGTMGLSWAKAIHGMASCIRFP